MNQYPDITVDGSALTEDRFTSCVVQQRLNGHWMCSFTCARMAGTPTPIEDWIGKSLSVTSKDDQGAETAQFAGFIVSVDLNFGHSGTYTAAVTAYSKTWLMDQSQHKQYYTDTTLQSLATQMAGRMGGAATVGVAASRPLNYVQYAETDFSFLDRVVDDYKAWLRPNADGFEIYDTFQPGSSLSWRGEAGGDLMTFSIGATVRPGNFQGSHYDFHSMESKTYASVTQQPAFFDAAAGLVGSVKQVALSGFPPQRTGVRARVKTNDEFETTLKDESERAIGGAVTGTGTSRSMKLKAGDTVTLTGNLGAAGTYGLTEVVHQWGAGGYGNTFVCTPWKSYRHPEEPTLRTWSGIVPARVTAHDDPKKMGRIQVQFFWQEDGTTEWARATSPHAGPDRGFMFMPEVGDEVAVAFEDGDPERPVILGSLWNGVHTAPRLTLRGDDIPGNDVKRIMTKSGNRLQFSDAEGLETVVLATPNNNRIKMTEKADASGRTNITIESTTGDIVLHAPNGRVHIESRYYSKDIGQQAAASSAVAAKKGGGPAPPTRAQQVKAWRKSHSKAIRRALANQRVYLLHRKAQLTAWDDKTKAQSRTWFGSDSLQTRQTLLDRTDKELALNSQMKVSNFQPPEPGQADPEQYAYVYHDDKTHTIYLDQQFDAAPPLGEDSQAGTLAHEMSHFDDISGTQDYKYSPAKARLLSVQDPGKAINNADSYEFFVEGIK